MNNEFQRRVAAGPLTWNGDHGFFQSERSASKTPLR